MKKQIVLRCYGERTEGQWVAVCLDFCLAAQADTFEEARALLDAQINSYLRDALEGVDREHADYLLSRRAPTSMWIKYYYAWALLGVLRIFGKSQRKATQCSFRETVPMNLAHC